MSSASPVTRAAEPRVLEHVLRPRAVAVVGASADPGKRGYQIVRALLDSGYAGAIHPVNPRGGEILGLPVFKDITDIADAPEMAVICTPAPQVADALESCARAGVRAAVVLALGFRESGAAGAALEERVRSIAHPRGMRVVGPNTSGILNIPLGLNLVGLSAVPRGSLALVVQSGNILLEQVTRAQDDGGEGYCICLGLGNMVDVSWADVLTDLAHDDAVRAIAMYAEGLGAGRKFIEAAALAARWKPIVLLKGGRTDDGHRAARSHTGALATRADVLRAALRAGGVIEAPRTDSLRALATALAWQPAPGRSGVVILSDGGGHATLAADAFAERQIKLAELSPEAQAALRQLLGPAATVANPVDVAGATDRDPAVFAAALRTILRDETAGIVLLVGLFGGYAVRFDPALGDAELRAAQEMAAAARAAGCAFVVHSLYHGAGTAAIRALRNAEVPVLGSLDTAVEAVIALRERARLLKRQVQAPLPAPGRRGQALLERVRLERRDALLEPEARELLTQHDVSLVPATFCETAGEAEAAALGMRGPVAMRVVSSTILHKSRAGGVRLDVTAGDAGAAFRAIVSAVQAYASDHAVPADVRGVMVSPMLPRPAAELLVGVHRDPTFGPVLTLGAGGTAVEVLRDTALRILPATVEDVVSALDELRNAPPAGIDMDAVARLALALGDCLLDNPELAALELNPVFADAQGAIAVDARAVLGEA